MCLHWGPNLCNICTKLFSGKADRLSPLSKDEVHYVHHASWASFHRAMQLGCSLCTKIWHKFAIGTEGKEVIEGYLLITSLLESIQLSSAESCHKLWFCKWYQADPKKADVNAWFTPDGLTHVDWVEWNHGSYLSTMRIHFEMVVTGKAQWSLYAVKV